MNLGLAIADFRWPGGRDDDRTVSEYLLDADSGRRPRSAMRMTDHVQVKGAGCGLPEALADIRVVDAPDRSRFEIQVGGERDLLRRHRDVQRAAPSATLPSAEMKVL